MPLRTTGRLLLTVFIEKDDEKIRIISARRATSHERKRYEEGI
ncbi:MAG: BrnT family toxin [Deltaproteobacteria bacterium]|nr:BrnT family toxin [Deltaproteobacteria bacterium]